MRNTTCHTLQLGESVSKSVARGYFTVADVPMVLAQALLISLAQDLGRAHAARRWRADPHEMLGSPALTAQELKLAHKLDSEAVQGLYAVVAGGSAGRVPTGRGTVLRMARRYSGIMSKYQRTHAVRKEAA